MESIKLSFEAVMPIFILMVIFAAPIAVSSYSMSQQMNGDETLAVQVIATSSVLCLVTLFLWIFVLSFLGLF